MPKKHSSEFTRFYKSEYVQKKKKTPQSKNIVLNYFFLSTYMKLHIFPPNNIYAWVFCMKIPETWHKASQPNSTPFPPHINYFIATCKLGKYQKKWTEKGKTKTIIGKFKSH